MQSINITGLLAPHSADLPTFLFYVVGRIIKFNRKKFCVSIHHFTVVIYPVTLRKQRTLRNQDVEIIVNILLLRICLQISSKYHDKM